MASSATTTTRTATSVNQKVAYVAGAIFLLIGILGWFVTPGHSFADRDGGSLLGFEVNPLHNIVHLLVGILLLVGARGGVSAARAANTAVGAVYLVVGIIGLFILNSSANILALNGADNVLHLVSGIVLLAAGLFADKAARR
jgi:Domain of unknown function (DUF4383)